MGAAANGAVFDLNTPWKLEAANGSISQTMEVPGSINYALEKSNVIPDAYFRANDVLTQWVAGSDWTASTTVQLDTAPGNALLQLDSVQGVADVLVNGVLVLQTDNMFIEHSIPVAHALVLGENTIMLKFRSITNVAFEREAAYPYRVPGATFSSSLNHANFVRTVPSSFGWDWSLALGPQGMYKGVRLVTGSAPVITAMVPLVQAHPDTPDAFLLSTRVVVLFQDAVAATVQVDALTDQPGSLLASYEVTLPVPASWGPVTLPGWWGEDGPRTAPGSTHSPHQAMPSASYRVLYSPGATGAGSKPVLEGHFWLNITVPRTDVQLWWTRGRGAQPLYNVTASVVSPQGSQARTRRVGYRTIERVEQPVPESGGLTFQFRVNGQPVWVRGAAWVPVDAYNDRASTSRVRALIASAAEANSTMLRIWGGGDTGADALYDAMDEAGILAWVDFVFASSLYPRTSAMLLSVREEVQHITRRISGHASVAIYCGSNEAVIGESLLAPRRSSMVVFVSCWWFGCCVQHRALCVVAGFPAGCRHEPLCPGRRERHVRG
jgi:beta-mannosidase